MPSVTGLTTRERDLLMEELAIVRLQLLLYYLGLLLHHFEPSYGLVVTSEELLVMTLPPWIIIGVLMSCSQP